MPPRCRRVSPCPSLSLYLKWLALDHRSGTMDHWSSFNLNHSQASRPPVRTIRSLEPSIRASSKCLSKAEDTKLCSIFEFLPQIRTPVHKTIHEYTIIRYFHNSIHQLRTQENDNNKIKDMRSLLYLSARVLAAILSGGYTSALPGTYLPSLSHLDPLQPFPLLIASPKNVFFFSFF